MTSSIHSVPKAYVIFLREMGGVWLERHLSTLVHRVLELVKHAKTISTHIEAVYSRRCVSFILRLAFGTLLGESAQFVAARQLCETVSQNTAAALLQKRSKVGEDDRRERAEEGGGAAAAAVVAVGGAAASEREEREARERDRELMMTQHAVICALVEIGALVYSLNTAALPLLVGDAPPLLEGAPEDEGGRQQSQQQQQQPPLLRALASVVLHPAPAARLAGAWCIHCVSLALPSQLSALVGHCLAPLRRQQGTTGAAAFFSVDAIAGHSYTVAALLGTTRHSELGVPSTKAKVGGAWGGWVGFGGRGL